MTGASDSSPFDSWIAQLAKTPPWEVLWNCTPDERERRGYADTLLEICQQPVTWERTAETVLAGARDIDRFLRRDDTRQSAGSRQSAVGTTAMRPMILTGSGSSQYVAECVAPALQARLGVVVRAVPAALFLTHAEAYVTASDPPVVVSFARSGDSPESTAVLDLLLDRYPACRHLAITCNATGKLATAYAADPRVMTVVLDRRTNDRSLVMTSSFTNMVIAGQALGMVGGGADEYMSSIRVLIAAGREILAHHAADLARIARTPFRSACFLGTGPRLGAAREAALKMLEMSGGEVGTMAETHLGLRHGPMAAVRDSTLVVASLPSSALARGYAIDVVHEIARKRLAAPKVLVGADVPRGLIGDADVAVALAGLPELDDGLATVADVVVGQILAFFRCLAGGLRPDVPSPDGIITRVVPEFPIYR
jgi:tagatose-6-phosphate ketose/aldose isomerase